MTGPYKTWDEVPEEVRILTDVLSGFPSPAAIVCAVDAPEGYCFQPCIDGWRLERSDGIIAMTCEQFICAKELMPESKPEIGRYEGYTNIDASDSRLDVGFQPVESPEEEQSDDDEPARVNPKLKALLDQDSPWDGEGLPPVGTECEATWDGKNWIAITPKYFGEKYVVYQSRELKEECASTLFQNYRPLKTPEEKAREEFEKDLADFIKKTLNSPLKTAGVVRAVISKFESEGWTPPEGDD